MSVGSGVVGYGGGGSDGVRERVEERLGRGSEEIAIEAHPGRGSTSIRRLRVLGGGSVSPWTEADRGDG